MDNEDVDELTLSKEVAAFLIIARYYGLSRLAALISTRVDSEAFAAEGDRETLFDNIMDLQKAAAREALAYGFVLEATSLSQTGSANQDTDQAAGNSSWARGFLETGFLRDAEPLFEEEI